MKVWLICEEHGERAYKAEVRGVIDLHCWVRDLAMRPPSSEWQGPPPGQTPCRVVEMVLHPAGSRVVTADALVIEKVDGEWPAWAEGNAAEAISYDAPNTAGREVLDWMLRMDALAQSKEGAP